MEKMLVLMLIPSRVDEHQADVARLMERTLRSTPKNSMSHRPCSFCGCPQYRQDHIEAEGVELY